VLISSAVEHFDGTSGPSRILDLGTGPGTLLLAALDIWPKATGLGIDASRRALSYASANARRLGSDQRADFRLGDWADGIDERFDLILCNPPYVATDAELGAGVAEHEPHEALFAGPEGLADIRRIAPEIPRLLAPGGLACIEIDPGQAKDASALLAVPPLNARIALDLAGRERAILLN
jgi:release factor glutamine methyltransferase